MLMPQEGIFFCLSTGETNINITLNQKLSNIDIVAYINYVSKSLHKKQLLPTQILLRKVIDHCK